MPAKGKRIAFDARYINDRYHGIGRYAFRMLECLAALNREDHFIVYRGKMENTRFDWQGLHSRPNVEIRDGPWPLYWPIEQLIWPITLRSNQVDLFYSPYIIAPLLARGIPTIITVHDLLFDRYPQYMPLSWSRPYYRYMLSQGLRRAQKVITVSHSTAADLQDFYEIQTDKIEVVSEGVDPGFHPVREHGRLKAIRETYQLERPYLLTVGVRRPHKNFAALVEAFARIAQDVPHELVFVGPADERFPDHARRAAAQSGMNGRVRFLDWVPEEHLAELYTQADGVVLPSLMEGFGLPALEAMACGTPVIASRSTSYRELVGEAGLLVDPEDTQEMAEAIETLINDLDLWQRLGTASLERASQFTWERAARRLQQMIEEVFKEKK